MFGVSHETCFETAFWQINNMKNCQTGQSNGDLKSFGIIADINQYTKIRKMDDFLCFLEETRLLLLSLIC